MIDPLQESIDPLEPASLVGATRFIPCTPRRLPVSWAIVNDQFALEQNPANEAQASDLWKVFRTPITAAKIAVLNGNKWGPAPQTFPVYISGASSALADKILAFANLWSQHCNKRFAWSNDRTSICRVSLEPGGYWSYVGTDNRAIPLNEQTMNLEGFTLNTPEAEYHRVVCHEFGHFLGCPHEHMRRDVIGRLNPTAVYRYFRQNQGWSREETRRQVLTPIEETALLKVAGMEPFTDETSIMCYQLPGTLTTDGRPVTGGDRINDRDAAYMGRAYPKIVAPPSVETWIGELRSSKGRVLRGNLEDVTT